MPRKKPKAPAPRRRGPAPRLDSPVKFSTHLTERHRDLLFAYAERLNISVAEATRNMIELLAKDGGKECT